jgi:AhpD family alkylhydroperoxidase
VRVTEKALAEYPWYLRPFFWNQKRKYGQVLKPALLWARSPLIFLSIALLYGALDRKRSPLDPVLRSLVTVRVSQINWCRFCVDLNSMTLLKRAGSAGKLEDLAKWRTSTAFTETERAALEYAEAMTISDQRVTEQLADRLKLLFDENALVELTGLIAFQNMSSKFNAALDVPSQGFCQVPAATSPGSPADQGSNADAKVSFRSTRTISIR